MKFVALLPLVFACMHAPQAPQAPHAPPPKAVVIVSANMEWKVVRAIYPDARVEQTPWGEAFVEPRTHAVLFHGGWGKVAAAGSAQYAINRWHPRYVVNMGTAGGLAGRIDKGAVVLADRTVIYDIKEAMGDSTEAINDYATAIDLRWLRGPLPAGVVRTLLVSGDRDLVPGELAELVAKYGAVAGDWESGAIAYTCARNHQKVVILRGISDLVSPAGDVTYGNVPEYEAGADAVMRPLLRDLPAWLDRMP